MKKVIKTETVEEFMARGGTVKQGTTKYARGSVTFKKLTSGPEIKRQPREEQSNEVDMNLIPENLKIALGLS